MASPDSSTLMVISAMITPSLLILGSGSLMSSALSRLGRVVDRGRVLAQTSEAEMVGRGWTEAQIDSWLITYRERSLIAERAVTFLSIGVAIFVLDCLSIAVDFYLGGSIAWLPISLTIIGMLCMLEGAFSMVLECRQGGNQIREEMRRYPSET